jgi:hypothetical protein
MKKLMSRNQEDAAFRHYVKLFESIIHDSHRNDVTPLDLRDAFLLARYNFELTNPRPVHVSNAYFNTVFKEEKCLHHQIESKT